MELSWAQVHAFRLHRHHLDRRAPKKDLARVVGDIGGAQAQVMSAAEMQIATRVDCTVKDVRNALWIDRSLAKTWLMRGTLHLVQSDDLPMFVGAMGRHWVSQMRPSWLKYMDVTAEEFWAICDDIGAAVSGSPLSREELIAKVGHGRSEHVLEILRSGWGGMLKPAARNGLLCFGPNRGQSVTFVSPRLWLHSWRTVDPEAAIVDVARRYVRVYGPATKVDFARWWGGWPGVANAAWKGLAPELASVSIEGRRAEALSEDVPVIKRSKFTQPVVLLPLFDPYLMGYASRDHLVEKKYAAKVSRTAGWISAVVLLEGTVAGTWTHTLKNGSLHVAVAPFRRLSTSVKAEVKKRAREFADSVGADKVVVKVA